jgi:hypothetical protein
MKAVLSPEYTDTLSRLEQRQSPQIMLTFSGAGLVGVLAGIYSVAYQKFVSETFFTYFWKYLSTFKIV